MDAVATEPAQTSEIYRRNARRIRARWAGNSKKTISALEKLRQERTPPQTEIIESRLGAWDWSQSAILGHRTAASRDFADLVAAQLQTDSPLSLSGRQWLIHEASRRNIRRFEANLIIAAVQHHLETPVQNSSQSLSRSPWPARRRRFAFPTTLATVLALQIAILLTAWHLFFS